MTTLPKDFKEFFELLNKHGVKYLVIGGYAVVYHGYVRSTNDIDIWVDIDPGNINDLLKVLDEFGFSSLNITSSDFQPNRIIQLGYPPHRIDLITSPAGVDFATCYAARECVLIDDIHINFIDLSNLIKAKLASKRTRDLADVEELS